MDKKTIKHIMNILRKGTVTWHVRAECLNRGRYKAFVDGKKLWARDCDGCQVMHLQKNNDLEVDHIIEVGPFTGDIGAYAAKMYCSIDNLQALCFSCHKKKTSGFNAKLRFERKVIGL